MAKVTKDTADQWFERCWIAYNRKGAKKVARAQWDKLHAEDRAMAEAHIPHYVGARERVYCKDFERYLRDRVFENPVYDSKGELLYDPDTRIETDEDALVGFQG